MIVALPAATAVTLPASTVATSVLLEVQAVAATLASVGSTVAVSVSSSPVCRARVVLLSVTDVTGMRFSSTVTTQVAVFEPSSVVTVMVAVPTALAVTLPFWSISTTSLPASSTLQVMFLLVASSGATVATKVSVSPSLSVSVVLFSVTPVTDTCLTL